MYKLAYISILFMSFFYSCTESIELDLNTGDNNKLVVEGSVTNEYINHKVKLSRTSSYFYNKPNQPELGAQVSITDGDTTLNLVDSENSGIYTTDIQYAGKPNHSYTLNIRLSDGQQYTSTEFLKPIAPMDSVKCEYKKSEIPFDKKYYYNINIFAQEDPTPGNYYQWEVVLNDVNVTDTLRLKVLTNDEIVNGVYINNWTVYRISEDKIDKDVNELTLKMLSISKGWYEFYYAVLSETDFSGSFFSGPPANVPSNISNGALGYFRVSCVTQTSIKILKQQPN